MKSLRQVNQSHKHGLKSIRLHKGLGSKRTLSLQQINRNLAIYSTRWWIVGLAVIVLSAGFRIYPSQDIGGGNSAASAPRYRTIAQLASITGIDDFDNPLNSEEYSIPLDNSGDYLFKTGGTDTIISRSTRKETIKYIVRSGENLNTLANDFGITTLTLKYANNLSSTTLKVGQELRVPPIDGLYVTVKRNDTLSSLATRYKVKVDDIQKYNGLTAGGSIVTGQELLIPGAVMPKVTTPASGANVNVPAYNPIPYSGKFAWPTESPTHFLSQGPRKGHMAIDLNRLNGWGIYASAGGVIQTKTGYNGGYGNLIIINHGSSWSTYYGHLSQFKVKSGDYVQQGQLIGIMGSTGRSTGTHLHFEIRHGNALMNPLDYLPR